LKIHDFIIIGSGIGCAGLISKLNVTPDLIITRQHNEYFEYDIQLAKDDDYLVRKKFGNAHHWGGVITLSNYELKTKGESFYNESIINYFRFSDQCELSQRQTCNLIVNELKPRPINKYIKFRKLLVTNNRLLHKKLNKLSKKINYSFDDVNSLTESSNGVISILSKSGELIAKTKKVALCAGVLSTLNILKNSKYINDLNKATDSVFGRVGRIRFENKLPFGLFHHHVISKNIRFKTGFEVKKGEISSMFFLQPAIEGLPASDIQILKKYLTLKANFKLKDFFSFFTNFKLIIQILMMEFSLGSKTREFDVYCISELGECDLKFFKNNKVSLIPPPDIESLILDNYKCFHKFLAEGDGIIKCIDHKINQPLFNNFESALHLSGTLINGEHVCYDHKSRTYHLLSNNNILINDNSIIVNKGVANPSISLF
jgi:hypothetical protein